MNSSNNSNQGNKLKAKAGDYGHALIKAGISAIPIIGGSAAELFSAIVTPPLSRRRDKWIEEIAEGLRKLEEKFELFKIEDLSLNEIFITTIMHASQAAIRNHQEEKLEALRNAVYNSALPNPPEESLQLMFLNLVDNFTAWHLKLLNFFNNPLKWGETHGITFPSLYSGGRSHILETAFPELKGQRAFYDPIFRELFLRGLVTVDSLHVTMTAGGLFQSCTSNLGKEFLKFIESPLRKE